MSKNSTNDIRKSYRTVSNIKEIPNGFGYRLCGDIGFVPVSGSDGERCFSMNINEIT